MDDNADFICKLRQIEETAYLVGAAVEDSRQKASLRQVALTARLLQARLEMGAVAVVPVERRLPEDAVKKPPA